MKDLTLTLQPELQITLELQRTRSNLGQPLGELDRLRMLIVNGGDVLVRRTLNSRQPYTFEAS